MTTRTTITRTLTTLTAMHETLLALREAAERLPDPEYAPGLGMPEPKTDILAAVEELTDVLEHHLHSLSVTAGDWRGSAVPAMTRTKMKPSIPRSASKEVDVE